MSTTASTPAPAAPPAGPDLAAALRAACPGLDVSTDAADIEGHRHDWGNDPGAGTPLAVVRPTSTEQVQAVVRFAAARDLPLVPRGAGSGLSGGASAVDGGMVVSLAAMTDVEIDPGTGTAVVGAGAINADVKRAAARHGLWYPPDPASVEISSIGGNVATNAGGLCCVKYGVTDDYVLGLTVVLADGTAVQLGGTLIKEAAGLSMLRLFVGSEGTLGIITRVVLRLLPAQPPVTTLVASFADLGAACTAVQRIAGRLRPSMLELMDAACIAAVDDELGYGLDRTAQAMLIVQSDQPGVAAAAEIAVVDGICRDLGATSVDATDDAATAERLTAARRSVVVAMERRGRLLLGDVGVPVPQLAALVTGIAALSAEHEVPIALVAHAGDGNTHPLVVVDPDDADQAVRGATAYGEVMRLAMSLGGTITGEHGVGRTKKAWLPEHLGPDVLALHRRVKDALDPSGILNPGALF